MDLQQIGDRIEIQDLLVRYTRAVDDDDWDLWDTVFTSDATIDYSATGGANGTAAEVKQWLRETVPMFVRRMHMLGQSDVVVDDARETATVVTYFHNPMVMLRPDGSEHVVQIGGRYHHDLVRTGDGWRSARMVIEQVWRRGI